MSKHLQSDLGQLERDLLEVTGIVEEMIEKAWRGLLTRRLDHVPEILRLEGVVDEAEVRIENECLKILALHQPVAGDLRFVATVLKVNNELERIADLAVNICERSESLAGHPDFPLPAHLDQMALKTVTMVRDALDSLVRQDVVSARAVLRADDEVDAMNRYVIDELTAVMREHPQLLEQALHCFSASRHIERIADHATNIAEDVVYLVNGEIARHKQDTVATD